MVVLRSILDIVPLNPNIIVQTVKLWLSVLLITIGKQILIRLHRFIYSQFLTFFLYWDKIYRFICVKFLRTSFERPFSWRGTLNKFQFYVITEQKKNTLSDRTHLWQFHVIKRSLEADACNLYVSEAIIFFLICREGKGSGMLRK